MADIVLDDGGSDGPLPDVDKYNQAHQVKNRFAAQTGLDERNPNKAGIGKSCGKLVEGTSVKENPRHTPAIRMAISPKSALTRNPCIRLAEKGTQKLLMMEDGITSQRSREAMAPLPVVSTFSYLKRR